MDLELGSNRFRDVKVPVLWGNRAILQDRKGRISVVDLGGTQARLEIVGDEPAPDVEFTPTVDGFKILRDGDPIYTYSKEQQSFSSLSSDLPDVEISDREIQIGRGNVIQRSMISGFDVGVRIDSDGFAIGASLPEGLAALEL